MWRKKAFCILRTQMAQGIAPLLSLAFDTTTQAQSHFLHLGNCNIMKIFQFIWPLSTDLFQVRLMKHSICADIDTMIVPHEHWIMMV